MNNNLISNKIKLKNRPVPNLKETEKNYLKFLKAYGNEYKNEIESSEMKLREFVKKQGVILQKRLLDRNKILSSWLYDLVEQNNLKQRDPIAINGNYYILFDFKFKNQIDAVAKLILCSNMIKKIIRENKLEQISNKCPMQYFLLFNSCLSPFLEKDKLLTFDYAENNHIIILHKNNFWVLEETSDYEKICEQIEYIISHNVLVKDDDFIGFLTTGDRNKYASVKEKFLNVSKKNKDFMHYVEESMMIISLEDESSTDLDLKDISNFCWFNEGQNRFYDKLLQFVILKDGSVSMNVKKGFIDKSVCIEFSRLINEWANKNEVYYLNEKNKEINKNYFENFTNKPHMLSYDLNDDVKESIKEFNQSFANNKENIQTDFFIF